MAKAQRKQQARLQKRVDRFNANALSSKPGYRKPGSQNRNKR